MLDGGEERLELLGLGADTVRAEIRVPSDGPTTKRTKRRMPPQTR